MSSSELSFIKINILYLTDYEHRISLLLAKTIRDVLTYSCVSLDYSGDDPFQPGCLLMSLRTEKPFQSLIDKLPEFREREGTPERHIYLLWLITRAVTILGGERPILVGGGAVEFYTGIRFATGDLDLVAPDIRACQKALEMIGFERQPKMKHFVNRVIGGLVEIHSSKLRADEEIVELVYRKVPLLLVSPEDCITDRLKRYKKHGSTIDLLNAFMIMYHQESRIEEDRLAKRIDAKKLWDQYRPLQDICRELILNEIGVDETAAALIYFMKKGTKECAF